MKLHHLCVFLFIHVFCTMCVYLQSAVAFPAYVTVFHVRTGDMGERGRGEGGEGRWRGKTRYGIHTYTELECCNNYTARGRVTTMVTMSHCIACSIYSPPSPMASQFVRFECQKVPVMGERKP